MSVLVFVELHEGEVKKTSLEAIYYGAKVAEAQGGTTTVLAIGEANEADLAKTGNYGANKVLHANTAQLAQDNIMAYAAVLVDAVKASGATVVVTAKSSLTDPVTARAAAALQAGIVGNVTDLPDLSGGFTVKRSIFSGKAFAETTISTPIKILGIKKNAVSPVVSDALATVEAFNPSIDSSLFTSKITETIKATGTVSLPEADIVVSGGRGMKGPEHWQPLLDLADALGAATACSKPVSDLDWRPHHEHVGQTGVKVAPNLYIACGISGAIQHLAGVNSSKVIVVINKDPEAPFFKAADYGIVGDVFEVLPKLTAAVKNL